MHNYFPIKNSGTYLRVVCLWFMTFLLNGCDILPKKDKHPGIPYLKEFLQDSSKVTKVFIKERTDSRLYFLKDDRLLFLPNVGKYSEGPSPFKVFDVTGFVFLELTYKDHEPLFIDSIGSIYYANTKYFYPDYQKKEPFTTIVILDSIENRRLQLEKDSSQLSDSIRNSLLQEYEKNLETQYAISHCQNVLTELENKCDIFYYRDGKLIIRQNELYKNDFLKEPKPISEFDKEVLVRYQGGGGDAGLFGPIYLKYFTLGGNSRFKEEDYPYPGLIVLHGTRYLYSVKFGLFKVL